MFNPIYVIDQNESIPEEFMDALQQDAEHYLFDPEREIEQELREEVRKLLIP